LYTLSSSRPPTLTLFPYTTLFRSRGLVGQIHVAEHDAEAAHHRRRRLARNLERLVELIAANRREDIGGYTAPAFTVVLKKSAGRSEEHTSELQSRFDLVCRLLLEK